MKRLSVSRFILCRSSRPVPLQLWYPLFWLLQRTDQLSMIIPWSTREGTRRTQQLSSLNSVATSTSWAGSLGQEEVSHSGMGKLQSPLRSDQRSRGSSAGPHLPSSPKPSLAASAG